MFIILPSWIPESKPRPYPQLLDFFFFFFPPSPPPLQTCDCMAHQVRRLTKQNGDGQARRALMKTSYTLNPALLSLKRLWFANTQMKAWYHKATQPLSPAFIAVMDSNSPISDAGVALWQHPWKQGMARIPPTLPYSTLIRQQSDVGVA